jgi:hypothetical protein
MDKNQILSFITTQLQIGAISKEDLYAIAEGTVVSTAVPVATPGESSRNLINTFYAIGAIIAIVGVGILVQQHWEEIGFAGRILVTLGIALVTFISAMLLRKPTQRVVSQVFFTVAAALSPLGVYVLLSERGMQFDASTQALSAAALTVIFLVALLVSKKNILVLLTTGFGTWAFYAFAIDILNGNNLEDFLKWGTMIVGVAYILIGFWYRSVSKVKEIGDEKEKRSVGSVLYALGTLAALGAGISVGGVFDLIFILFVFAAFYGSVFLKSRSMLILAALFLIGHIFKLTGEYFVDSVGWPIALVVIGFLVIGVGSLTYYVNKKFITR